MDGGIEDMVAMDIAMDQVDNNEQQDPADREQIEK